MVPVRDSGKLSLDSRIVLLYNDFIVNDLRVNEVATARSLQKEATRKKLLAAALAEFGRRGIMATRVSDVASAAGVSHGTAFVHFKTQEMLIVAAVQEFTEHAARRTHELASNCSGLREVLAAHLAAIGEVEPFYSRLVIEARFLPPAARERYILMQSAISFHISQAAQREMDARTIPTMPIALLFNTWVGLINYYIANGDLFAPGGSVIARCGPVLLDHFMNLIAARQEG